MKKNYIVEFCYGTDLRCSWEGQAWNEYMALAAAMTAKNLPDWAIEPGFSIRIVCV